MASVYSQTPESKTKCVIKHTGKTFYSDLSKGQIRRRGGTRSPINLWYSCHDLYLYDLQQQQEAPPAKK